MNVTESEVTFMTGTLQTIKGVGSAAEKNHHRCPANRDVPYYENLH